MNQRDFGEYCVRHRDDLVAFARKRCGGDVDRAEDIVQESYAKAVASWSRFEIDGDVDVDQCIRGWLFTIVSNTFVNTYLHNKMRVETSLFRPEDLIRSMTGLDDVEVYHEGVNETGESVPMLGRWDTPADASDYSDTVWDAMRELDDNHRDVVLRTARDGYSYDECAREFGVPLGTIMSRLHRARTRLQELLGDYAASVGVGVQRPVYEMYRDAENRRAPRRVDAVVDPADKVAAPTVRRRRPASTPARAAA